MISYPSRILIIDDDQDIWKAYQLVLDPEADFSGEHLRQLEELLEITGEKDQDATQNFQLSFADQGQDGCKMALSALEEGNPFALAFVDVRMPPGWDGMETSARLHQIDPDLEIVIVTAYSDRSCDEIVREVGSPHKLLFLRKPFDAEELKRLAVSLTDKWHMARDDEARKQELQTLLCTSPAAIFSIDEEQRMLSWNQSAVLITGFSADEVIGGPCIFRRISEDQGCKSCSGSCEYDEVSVEKQFAIFDKNSDRKVLSMSIAHVPALKDRPAKSIGSFWDITALKETQAKLIDVNQQLKQEIVEKDRLQAEQIKLERKLNQARKMEALGLMAGGVAHDLNNILSGLVGYPELLLMQLPEDSELRESILAISDSGKRAAAVVSDLLTIARGSTSVRETVNVNSLITEYLDSPEGTNITYQYPDITIRRNLAAEKMYINCSPVHIKKCLMNLLTNAYEAIGSHGSVEITSYVKQIEQPESSELDINKGRYVVISVADTGPGISTTDQERIFEPFYTKKSMGSSGTGLGLTVVWNTIKDHAGTIVLESSSAGTTFTLYFPASGEGLTKKKDKKTLDDLTGTGTILVVDDERQQRDITSKMLAVLGYSVEVVSSGEDAISFLQDHTVDLVLLDMIMDPGINGRETFRRIVELYPKQKALFISGYSRDEDVEGALLLGADGFIRKPYTLEQLGLAVKQQIDSISST